MEKPSGPGRGRKTNTAKPRRNTGGKVRSNDTKRTDASPDASSSPFNRTRKFSKDAPKSFSPAGPRKSTTGKPYISKDGAPKSFSSAGPRKSTTGKPYISKDGAPKSFSSAGPRKPTGGKPYTSEDGVPKKPFGKPAAGSGKPFGKGKPYDREQSFGPRKPGGFTRSYRDRDEKKAGARPKRPASANQSIGEGIRLNRYLATAGVCSRRQADELIETGVVKINGVIVTELGTRVKPGDVVLFGDRRVTGEPPVYVLLNKPKDFITTTKDPQNRRTVMELVSDASPYRLYPVGRLDRGTTGVLLLTNDGAMAEKLAHPASGIEKIYHATLDQKFTAGDMDAIRRGVNLEDGSVRPDEVDWVTGEDKSHVGIRLHSGRNRVVRRMFEALGYNVIRLDRVLFAGLTKKGLGRGEYRHLTDTEVNALKRL
jgi:23S rRNA pseudouridine2605 synthase